MDSRTPNNTVIKEVGKKEIFFASVFFQTMSINRDKPAIKMDPMEVCWYKLPRCEKAWFNLMMLNNSFDQKSSWSYPIINGTCFEISKMPIAVSMPLMTAEGIKWVNPASLKMLMVICNNPAMATERKNISISPI